VGELQQVPPAHAPFEQLPELNVQQLPPLGAQAEVG
jgi:hypothetical protein